MADGIGFVLGCILLAFALFMLLRSNMDDNSNSVVSAASPCPGNNVQLMLPETIQAGTIQLLAAMMDTDAKASRVYKVKPVTCIPVADLQALGAGGGLAKGSALELDIGFDPEGTPGKYRSRLQYEVLMPEELGSTPAPPAGMRFGSASWSPGQAGPMEITWIPDLRKSQEEAAAAAGKESTPSNASVSNATEGQALDGLAKYSDYAAVRARLIQEGFEPTVQDRNECASDPDYFKCAFKFPETEDCSGTGQGYCLYKWSRQGETFVVRTVEGEGGGFDDIWRE